MKKVKIHKIEDSNYDKSSKVIYFYYDEKEEYAVLNSNVRKYIGVDVLEVNDEIFVTRSFTQDRKGYFLIRKCQIK